jgi:Fur family ferric uptake transcriptional regulator
VTTAPDTLAAALDRSGVRLTDARRAVAELVATQSGHFTANDLIDAARNRRLAVGRASVFRTLDLLVELNLVERLDLPSGEHAYVACDLAHHHHVVCSRCRRTVEVDDAGIGTVLRRIALETGYEIDDHRLEVFGLCPECRRQRTS